MDITDKAIIVTGGCGGLGTPVVRALAERGASVGVLDFDPGGLERLAAEVGSVMPLDCDLTDPADVDKSVAAFFEVQGRIDGLVNNAGILYNEPLVKFGPKGLQRHGRESWRKVMSLNLDAVFETTSAVVERMIQRRTRGVVVNISSIAAQGNPGQSAYAASKAAVEALTKTWALELGVWGIRCACVAPGYTGTGSTHAVMNEDTLDHIVSEVPLRRLGEPEEIASAVLFCLENDFMNGKVLAVDGGLVL